MINKIKVHVTEFLLLLAALAAGCAGQGGQGGSPGPMTIDFESAEVGKPPPGFATELTGGGGPVSWLVREDPSAPSGGKALVQESADDTSYRFPLCILEEKSLRDVAVEVKYKAISGKVDQAGGIVLRYASENYYIARANALEDNVNLFRTENGKRVKIEEVPVKVTPGEWHTLRFEAKGPHLRVDFDGKTVIEKEDATFPEPGKVGLWTKADSVTAFDDFKIEPVR
ncbi:family 16 glycoside hydrolase [Aquisphaera insulae]|uniref:family 16 glycoside hydrolase n=1 Tax=Aquisphaera insulae TaxID=2712864 RepID=UPI0013EB9B05|nr:family 16 glycoside hydrolase [Aquisphaera insulae]